MQRYDFIVLREEKDFTLVEVADPANKINQDCLTYEGYIPNKFFDETIKPNKLGVITIQENIPMFIKGYLNSNIKNIKIKKGINNG